MNILIKKTGRVVEIDRAKFNDRVNEYVFTYGLTQILNDCHSSVTKKSEDYSDDKVHALVDKKLAALIAGELRTPRGEGSSGDPVADRAWMLAGKDIRKAMTAAGIKRADVTDEQMESAIEAHLEANLDDYMTKAKAALEAEAKAAKSVDLKSLFGR